MTISEVIYKKDGERHRVKARKVEHVYQGPTLFIEAIPRDDPGGKRRIKVPAENLVEITGNLHVWQYKDSSGKLRGSRLYRNSSGDWELMGDFGPQSVKSTWRTVR